MIVNVIFSNKILEALSDATKIQTRFFVSTLILIASINPEPTVFQNPDNAHEQAETSVYPYPVEQGAFLLSDGDELLE